MRIYPYFRYANTFLTALLKPETSRANPIHLQVEPTTECNMDCKMCARSGNAAYQKEHQVSLSLDTFKEVIETIDPLKINLTGNGESTLNRELITMISLCKRKGIYVYMNTNLLVSKEVLERLVRSNVDLIKVSLDAATPELHWLIRRNRSFDKVLENLHYMMKLREANASNTSIRINAVLMSENKDELCGILKIAKESKVDLVVVKQQCFYGDIEGDRAYYERLNFEPEVFKRRFVMVMPSGWKMI